jgi:hypothetical protein
MSRKYSLKKAKLEYSQSEHELFSDIDLSRRLENYLCPPEIQEQALSINESPSETVTDFTVSDDSHGSSSDETSSESEGDGDVNVWLSQNHNVPCEIELFLTNWSVRHNISQVALSDLLKYLKSHDCYRTLPSDPRTLLKTPKSTPSKPVPPGEYIHFGLKTELESTITKYNLKVNPLKLIVNIDGLPVFKSTNSQFWPVLGYISETETPPFVIGVYYGTSKPKSSKEYLSDFVDELVTLQNSGFSVLNTHFSVKLFATVCDAPAKSFVLGVKGHTGYYGCVKCEVKGEYINRRVCYPDIDAPVRTYNNEPSNFIEESAFDSLGVDFATDFPLDYMHLVCLGVTKKLLHLWLRGDIRTFRLCARDVDLISVRLLECTKYISADFCRRPRSLREVDRWKATEFRQFLLYTGPVVLNGVLPEEHYNLFMSLSVAIRILCSANEYLTYLNYSNELLRYFVTEFSRLYGKEYISYNVHNLIHLASDSEKYGKLDTFSGFRFENKLGSIKRLLRGTRSPLQQLHHRLVEATNSSAIVKAPNIALGNENYSGPNVNQCRAQKQYKFIKIRNVKFAIRNPDNICVLDCGKLFIIKNIVQKDGELHLFGNAMTEKINFFTLPCASSNFGIYSVKMLKTSDLQQVPVSTIKFKCIMLPLNDIYAVFLPILHSQECT